MGQTEAPVEGHTGPVWSVTFSSDGSIRLWDAATGKQIGAPLKGHTRWVESVAFSPNGTKITFGSADATIRLMDVATEGFIRRSHRST